MPAPTGAQITLYDASTTVITSTSGSNITAGQVVGNTAPLDNTDKHYNAILVTVSLPGGFASSPAANRSLDIYISRVGTDGTTYGTAGSGVTSTPANPSGLASSDGMDYLLSLPVASSTAAQVLQGIAPFDGVEKAKFVAFNNTGQTINAGGGNALVSTVKPFTVGVAP